MHETPNFALILFPVLFLASALPQRWQQQQRSGQKALGGVRRAAEPHAAAAAAGDRLLKLDGDAAAQPHGNGLLPLHICLLATEGGGAQLRSALAPAVMGALGRPGAPARSAAGGRGRGARRAPTAPVSASSAPGCARLRPGSGAPGLRSPWQRAWPARCLLGPLQATPRQPLQRAAWVLCRKSMSRVTLLHLNRKRRGKGGGVKRRR